MSFKPLLAATIDPKKDSEVLQKLIFPLAMSPKIDGIRGVGRENGLVSRKLELIPNLHTRQRFAHLLHRDGELTVTGTERDQDCLNKAYSAVMTIKGEPSVTWWVFDWAEERKAGMPFMERHQMVKELVEKEGDPLVKVVPHKLVYTLDEFLEYEDEQIALGFEGVMGRHPKGIYKWNRSTFREHILLKYKRFEDDEATIIGFEEQMTNGNALETNELGYAKRSKAAAGMIPADTLGKFICDYQGEVIKVTPGVLKHPERKAIWDARNTPQSWLGALITFRHFPHGKKDLPRHARFVARRSRIDL